MEGLQNGRSITHEHLWTKTFILVILVNFLMFMSMYLLMPTLPVYAQEIGGSKTAAGLIVGLFTLSAVVVRPWSGSLADRRGRKVVLIGGIVIFLGSVLAYRWIYTVVILLGLRLLHGTGWGAMTTAAGTIAADVIPARRRAEGMGYYGLSTVMAMSAGPYLGLRVMEQYSFQTLFFVSALIAAVGLFTALLISYEGIRGNAGREVKQAGVIEKTALPPSLVLFFAALTYGGIITFLPSYAAYRGIRVEDVGLFFTVYALVLLFSRPVMGRLADRYGAGAVLVPGTTILSLALLTLSAAGSLPWFLLAAVLYGLGFGAIQPVLNAVAITLAPVERRGAANATFFSAMDLGIGFGAVLLGALSQRLGYSLMYVSSAVFALASLITYLFFLRGKLAKPEKQRT